MPADPAGHAAPGLHRIYAGIAHLLMPWHAALPMHEQGSLLEMEQDVMSRSQVLSQVSVHLAFMHLASV